MRKKQYVVMVLDCSGSMEMIQKEACDAFNRQVETIRKFANELDVRVGLVTFGETVATPIWDAHPDALAPLTSATYRPNGWTPMYDGIGTAIERLERQPDIADPNTTVLVMTISDGQENSSQRWSGADIARNIKRLEETKRWTFTYEGANQDVFKVVCAMGMSVNNSMTFQASSAGMRKSTGTRMAASTRYFTSVVECAEQNDGFYGATVAQSATDQPSADPVQPSVTDQLVDLSSDHD